jgi:NOL1/NOP2/fmu family ribosome biogenesis protein
MVYSTCSFSYEENEEVIKHLLENTDASLVDIEQNPSYYVDKTLPYGVHLFPHLFNGDGQYICLIQKPGILTPNKIKKEDDRVVMNLRKYFKTESYYLRSLKRFGDYLFALPYEFKYPNDLNIVRYGIKVGELINNDKINLDHHYSRTLTKYIDEIDLDEENLKRYLKGETLNIQKNKGYILIKYNNIPLSWGKSDGRIIKNHLPKGLRRL